MPHKAVRALLYGAFALSVFSLSGCADRGPGSEVADAPNELEIPFEKYTLDNGLDVVLHQDRSDPIVALATFVHVGSSREKLGRTGFAHFFEHMSFNDSENVPRGANRKRIEELGGTRNGGTSNDMTMYYEVVPKDALEKLLWIDSDRLGYMIKTVTKGALENEKQVVKNEKRQRVDNAPYGHTGTVIAESLYPEGHPYSWSVIGSLEDLQGATLGDVREFYDRYYGPNNATLVIAGDFEIEPTKKLVESYFGEIARGPEVTDPEPQPASLEESKSLFHEDGFAKLPELRMVFPTVEQYHPDSYALQALADLLTDGKRAVLYKTLVEERELAPRVVAFHRAQEIAGSLALVARANPGTDLDEVHAAISEALDEFAKEGFDPRDLDRIKADQETSFYNGVSSVLNKAFQLAGYNEFAGDPGFITEDLARLKAVTREDVMRVFEKYVHGQPFVMTSFVPRGAPELAVSGARPAPVVEEQVVKGVEQVFEDQTASYEKTVTELDRSSEPPLGESPLLEPPEIWQATLDNGLEVLGIEHRELPLVQFSFNFDGGHWLDAPGKAGTAFLLAQLMMEGTANRTPQELEDAIGRLGASIRFSASSDSFTVTANCLDRHFEEVLALTVEMLLEPRFDEQELERLHREQLTRIRQNEGNPNAISAAAFDRLLYGAEHPYGTPSIGTAETVETIALEDLESYVRRFLSPRAGTFLIAGSVEESRATDAVADLTGAWQGAEVSLPEFETPPRPEQPRLFFIDVPGSKQSILRVGALALDGYSEEFDDLEIANNRLGGGSSARLFQLLRIQKGFTYGARSGIQRRQDLSPLAAQTSVRANVTLESLLLLREQLRSYGETFTEQDLATTKNLMIKRNALSFETLGSLLRLLQQTARYDLPFDSVARRQMRIEKIELAEVRTMIDRYIDESSMTYLVVGDGATQLAELERFGLGKPTVLDRFGNPGSAAGF